MVLLEAVVVVAARPLAPVRVALGLHLVVLVDVTHGELTHPPAVGAREGGGILRRRVGAPAVGSWERPVGGGIGGVRGHGAPHPALVPR